MLYHLLLGCLLWHKKDGDKMIAVKPSKLVRNLKAVCDEVSKGETVIVPRPNNENVVIISEKEYNVFVKLTKTAYYNDYAENSPTSKAVG